MNSKAQQKFIGIEIGGSKLQLVTGDSSAIIAQSIRYSVDPAKGAVSILEKIQEGIQKLCFDNYIDAIGVGFGGPVDWKNGTVHLSHQVAGWQNFNIVNWLRHLAGKPVWIDNDANIAALAEAKYGSGSGNSPNLIKAFEWCRQNNVYTIALLGGKKGELAKLADHSIIINSTHYGRVEDCHMHICHMICYAFVELKELQ